MKKRLTEKEVQSWLNMGDDNFKKIDELTNKLTHGGPGRGQGRKKGVKIVPYETTTVRVPNPLLKSIEKQIADFKRKVNTTTESKD